MLCPFKFEVFLSLHLPSPSLNENEVDIFQLRKCKKLQLLVTKLQEHIATLFIITFN